MTQVKDEKLQARRAGGLLTKHRQMKERQNNGNLFSCIQEEEEMVVGGYTGTPHGQRHTQTKNQRHTFPANLGDEGGG